MLSKMKMRDQDKCSQKSDSVFNELRLVGKFCDAVIRVEEVEFQIHKIILSNLSPYLRALLGHQSSADKRFFDIPGLSPDTMQLIIEFAYTGSVPVTEDNVHNLMLAACKLKVIDIVQTCSHFLSEQLCPENCICIWQLSTVCGSSELQFRAKRYITDHFEEVVPCQEFLQLTVEELAEILASDYLNVRMESTVHEAILRWIAHRPEEREEHIAVLLSKARLALTSMEYININVMSNELVKSNNDCQETVNDVIQILGHMIRQRPSVLAFCNPLARPRLPNAVLLAIGGWSNNDQTNVIQAYDVRADHWINLANNLEYPRAYHGSVFLGGYVYCVGGSRWTENINSVSRLDLRTHTWHEVTPMYWCRGFVSVTVLNRSIYAIGGYDGQTRLSSAERYSPETNQWSMIGNMNERRSDASCTALQGKVYICGGFDGHEFLQTAECYNPETNQWTMIARMNTRRSGIAVVAFEDHVYVVGGYDGNDRLNSAEAYDPWTNTWQLVSSMLTPRSNLALEVLDEQLFAIGGFNGIGSTNNVERYDCIMDEWHVVCDMETSCSALSSCVVSEIPNMAEYAVPRDTLPFLHLEDQVDEAPCHQAL